MKIGVYKPAWVPRSMTITTGCVVAELELLGVSLLWFHDPDAPPRDADLLWDPWVGGGNTSPIRAGLSSRPLVLTIAGASLFSMPLGESGLGPLGKLHAIKNRLRLKWLWNRRAGDYARILTISEYAKWELVTYLGLPAERVVPVHLGKDERLVELEDKALASRLSKPYLLHLSYYQPKKNVDRLLAAYQRVADEPGMPDLLVVSTEYPGRCPHPKVSIVAEDVSREQIATYYRHAAGFVFPSLHETFAMPLTEAMLFGLPLVTASTTACPETAGRAALLVDPRDTDSIAAALSRLAREPELSHELAGLSLQRGKDFSWAQTARAYLDVFEALAQESNA